MHTLTTSFPVLMLVTQISAIQKLPFMPGKLLFTMLNFLNLNAVYKQCVLVMMYKVTLPSEEKPNGDLYHQGSRRMVTSTIRGAGVW